MSTDHLIGSEGRQFSSSYRGSEVRLQAVSRLTGFVSRGKNVEGFICAKIFFLNLCKLC